MARTGMANPIAQLRALCAAGTADYSVAGTSYWSDDQLQAVLDRYREDIFSEQLEPITAYDGGGTALYFDYYTEPAVYEEGTARFQIADVRGSAVTPDSINYQMGHISFGTVDQRGTAYYLTARRFDLNAAAADVWRQKAAQVALAYNFTADGQSLSRSQMIAQCRTMAELYASQAQPLKVQLRRGDDACI